MARIDPEFFNDPRNVMGQSLKTTLARHFRTLEWVQSMPATLQLGKETWESLPLRREATRFLRNLWSITVVKP